MYFIYFVDTAGQLFKSKAWCRRNNILERKSISQIISKTNKQISPSSQFNEKKFLNGTRKCKKKYNARDAAGKRVQLKKMYA